METPLAVLCYFHPRTKKRVKCKQRSRKHTHSHTPHTQRKKGEGTRNKQKTFPDRYLIKPETSMIN